MNHFPINMKIIHEILRGSEEIECMAGEGTIAFVAKAIGDKHFDKKIIIDHAKLLYENGCFTHFAYSVTDSKGNSWNTHSPKSGLNITDVSLGFLTLRGHELLHTLNISEKMEADDGKPRQETRKKPKK